MTGTDFKKWFAIRTGIGIEIGLEDLTVTVVRVRPSGVRVLGELTIPRFHEQPASEWGATYAAFLKKLGVAHLSAGVLLPRASVHRGASAITSGLAGATARGTSS